MAMPRGLIMLWHGSIATIPSGFKLCDGNNGTPDLQDKFVIGAGSSLDPGDTGGAATHTHPFTGDGHTHTLQAGFDLAAGTDISATTDPSSATGTTNAGSSLPPYYSLAYIMKT